jgi:hypothetical protein
LQRTAAQIVSARDTGGAGQISINPIVDIHLGLKKFCSLPLAFQVCSAGGGFQALSIWLCSTLKWTSAVHAIGLYLSN